MQLHPVSASLARSKMCLQHLEEAVCLLKMYFQAAEKRCELNIDKSSLYGEHVSRELSDTMRRVHIYLESHFCPHYSNINSGFFYSSVWSPLTLLAP